MNIKFSDHKLQLTPESALEQMLQLLDAGRFDQFIYAESDFYTRFIRCTETHEHHDRMFRMLDPIVSQYGKLIRQRLVTNDARSDCNSVCYFLPSLDNDLAHIELLTNLLSSKGAEANRKIFIAGFAEGGSFIRSRKISALAVSGQVTVITLKHSHQAVIEFAQWFLKNKIGLLISYSIPTLLPAWLSIFGSTRVAWHVTKFELGSFHGLQNGISGGGVRCETMSIDRVKWRRVPSSLPQNYLFSYDLKGKQPVRSISVNREQKISNPLYLDSVCEILNSNPQVEFDWTGRCQDAAIQGAFEARGLDHRTRFIGWINHVEALPNYDIFLDTFGLSGVVAAAAFSSGMPTLFMRGSGSWLECFEHEIVSELIGTDPDISRRVSAVLADTSEDYTRKASRLIRQVVSGCFDGNWQRNVGLRWFFSSDRARKANDRVLEELLNTNKYPDHCKMIA